MMYLSSDDCLVIHPSNKQSDFTIELPKPLQLDGKWNIELLHFRADLKAQKTEGASPLRNLYIFSSICEESYVLDNYMPILGHVPLDGVNTKAKKVNHSFLVPYQFKVVQPYVQRIRVYIKGDNLSEVSFAKQPSQVTLRLFQNGKSTL